MGLNFAYRTSGLQIGLLGFKPRDQNPEGAKEKAKQKKKKKTEKKAKTNRQIENINKNILN